MFIEWIALSSLLTVVNLTSVKFIPKIVQREKQSLKIGYVPQNYGCRIFMAIYGNLRQFMKIDFMHPSLV